jgi:Reverse transcriptase (RNA-dependent DNA polymerase)/Endonuclease-reverse transcriptase
LEPDLIFICETWCNSDTNNASLTVNGYKFQTELRCDRNDTANGIGGGLAVYSKDGLEILKCDQDIHFNQYCKLKVITSNDELYFYVIYRPPSGGNASKVMLGDLIKNVEKKCIMVGDFNVPDIDWEAGSARASSDMALLEAAQEAGLEQLVNFPTHVRGNTLDLLLTNIPERVSNVYDAGRLGRSDHCIICFEVRTNTLIRPKTTVKNWRKADWSSIKNGISNTTWPTAEDNTSVEEFWGQLRAKITELTDQHVPLRTINARKADWMTNDLLQLVRKKRRLWRRAKTGQGVAEYEAAAKELKHKIRLAKRNMEKKLASADSQNKKPFYNYVKNKTKSCETIGPLKSEQGAVITDEEAMANELNTCFSSVFTREDNNNVPVPSNVPVRTKLNRSFITTQKVRTVIKNLKKTSSAGPDGITTELLQQCTDQLSPILAALYRKSMNHGKVPSEWKKANVVPIFKKGAKSDPSNYRPISLTCVCCRVMESIIKEDITRHLDLNKIIKKSQHGFKSGRSCTTNLLEFLEPVTKACDQGQPYDVIYLDFAKAFDKVPHGRLLAKVAAAGIGGNLLKWISDWLKNRSQRVVINGKFSKWSPVLSGVPQGSVLGPLLFNIFINDLDDTVKPNQLLKKFADDTKLGQAVTNPADAAELQLTLTSLFNWSLQWGMQFNVGKCHVMHLGRGNPGHVYYMGGTQLKTTSSERDVGVIISDNLKPTEQCRRAAATANAVLGQIQRAFHYRDRHTYVRLYAQYVRPHLEFAAPAWAPWSVGDIMCLEKVQERAVKAVSGLKANTYLERLDELELPSLADRRIEADMCLTYKILSDSDKKFSEQWFEMAANRRPTRMAAGTNNLVPKRGGHDYRRGFFSLRVVDNWNRLPDAVKAAKTAAAFKRQYRQHMRA